MYHCKEELGLNMLDHMEQPLFVVVVVFILVSFCFLVHLFFVLQLLQCYLGALPSLQL